MYIDMMASNNASRSSPNEQPEDPQQSHHALEENTLGLRATLKQERHAPNGCSSPHANPATTESSPCNMKKEDGSSDCTSPSSQKNCAYRRPRNPAVLVLWIEEHAQNPYPSKAEKHYLAHYAGMTQRQLNDWFANARRNIKKVGYQTWKEKHSAYSAYFSGINPFRGGAAGAIANEGGSARMQPFSMATPGAVPSPNCPSDNLKLSSINYGRKDIPVPHHATPPPTALPPAKMSHNNRAFQYLIHPQQPSVLNAAHAPHQQPTVNSLRQVAAATAINPAAYYHSTCIRPVQMPATSINFMSTRPSNGSLFSSSGRHNTLPSQFNSAPIGITTPWTNGSAGVGEARSTLLQQERCIIPVNSCQQSSRSPVNILSPVSISSQGPATPKESETARIGSSPQPLHKPNSLAASPTSSEHAWGSNSSHVGRSTAHNMFENGQVSIGNSGAVPQPGQELDGPWCAANTWNNAYVKVYPVNILSPASISSQGPATPKESETAQIGSSPQPLHKPNSVHVAANLTTSEHAWGSNSSHVGRSTAHNMFENGQVSMGNGGAVPQPDEELDGPWCAANAWNNTNREV